MTCFCALVFLLFYPEEPPQSPNLSPAGLPCLYMLRFKKKKKIPAKLDSAFPRALMVISAPPSYELHPKDPLEFYTVTFGHFIAGVTRMIFGLLSKMKRKMIVVEAFVLFFSVTPELNGGSLTIDVLGDRHTEQILVINCLTV